MFMYYTSNQCVWYVYDMNLSRKNSRFTIINIYLALQYIVNGMELFPSFELDEKYNWKEEKEGQKQNTTSLSYHKSIN